MKQSENVREPGKRHLQLTGCLNLRELGGYATADGKLTRWRILLRGDSLHKLSPESQQTIIDYGVKTISICNSFKEDFVHLLTSPPQTILDTFSYLDEHYVGIKGYLQTIGINKLQIERIQTMLVN